MIISLKVENYRSIREQVEFSMRASSGSHLSDHLIDLPGDNGSVVRTAGFYGPNASGKSNFLKAFAALVYIITDSGNLKEGKRIKCYEPYLLSNKTKGEPTKFEVEFLVSDLRYIYKVEFDRSKIYFESLECFFSKIPSSLFLRDDSGWENIRFGNSFKGGNKKIPFFENNSYLSKIAGQPGAPESVRDIFQFFSETLAYLHVGVNFNKSILDNEENREIFAETTGKFLSLLDTGISKLEVRERDLSGIRLPEGLSDEIKNRVISENKHQFMFSHISENGDEVVLEKDNESDGTQRLLELAPALISSFINKRVFIVDEIDHNIHPHLAALILKLFNDSEVNTHNSQLIFSTHNMELMKPERMRRDQIWFSEKHNGQTSIFSLDDFEKDKVKASTPFNKWYDEGRFGGTPELNFLNVKNYFISLSQQFSEDEKNSTTLNNDSSDDVFGNLNNLPKFE